MELSSAQCPHTASGNGQWRHSVPPWWHSKCYYWFSGTIPSKHHSSRVDFSAVNRKVATFKCNRALSSATNLRDIVNRGTEPVDHTLCSNVHFINGFLKSVTCAHVLVLPNLNQGKENSYQKGFAVLPTTSESVNRFNLASRKFKLNSNQAQKYRVKKSETVCRVVVRGACGNCTQSPHPFDRFCWALKIV